MYNPAWRVLASVAIAEPMHSHLEGKVEWEPCTLGRLHVINIARGKLMEGVKSDQDAMLSDDHHESITQTIC
jgi:hypothetical protein